MKGVCFKGPLFSRSGLTSKTERGMEEEEDMWYLLKGKRAVAGHFHFLTVCHFLAHLTVLSLSSLEINTAKLPNTKCKYYKQNK